MNMENTTYQILDHHTGLKVGAPYTYSQRNRARNRAEKLNLEYGAHRYSASPIFVREPAAA